MVDDDQMLRMPAVIEMTGYKRSSIYNMLKAGSFPKPVTLSGGGAIAWRKSEVQAWIARQGAGDTGSSQRQNNNVVKRATGPSRSAFGHSDRVHVSFSPVEVEWKNANGVTAPQLVVASLAKGHGAAFLPGITLEVGAQDEEDGPAVVVRLEGRARLAVLRDILNIVLGEV